MTARADEDLVECYRRHSLAIGNLSWRARRLWQAAVRRAPACSDAKGTVAAAQRTRN